MVFLSGWLWWVFPAILVPAGLLLAWRWLNYRAVNSSYGDERLVAPGASLIAPWSFAVSSALVLLGLVFACLALLRPASVDQSVEFPSGKVDVVAVVDVSRSMAAQDYRGLTSDRRFINGTRLDMARQLLALELMSALRLNKLGIVTFAGEAFEQAYLGNDSRALNWLIEKKVTIGSAGGDGSNLWAAFSCAFKLFDLDSQPSRQRIIILFSDGGCDNGAAELSKVVEECRTRNIRVVVAGLGKNQPQAIPVAMLPERDRFLANGREFLQLDGETQMTARDEQFLALLAGALGGRYVRVDSPGDFRLQPLDFGHETVLRKAHRELFRYPLVLAVLCQVMAIAVLRARRRSARASGSPPGDER